ncbi:glycosyl hydrolase [Penicillium chermesinum]|nr:glycosyl hydrolase [Penicillium chermesinum]
MGFMQLHIDGRTFRDPQTERSCFSPDIPSHESNKFFEGDNVSFVGRPFSLEESHIHFQRLRKWGYNTIRYIFTWEAIEHAGPGIYDEEWAAFTVEILRIAKKYEFYVFMDPHQDVWSRFSGGNFKTTGAALVHNTSDNPAEFPKMVWSTNYTRILCQTMFTLFWAGRDYAPKAIIDGVNIQDYLQNHYIGACKFPAQKIHDAGDLEHDVVIGWESMNEPHRGLIGFQDISVIPADQQLKLGTCPTAFQAMLTGSGRPCELPTWAFGSFGPYQTGRELLDPAGVTTWLSTDLEDRKYGWKRDPGWKLGECIWAQHGVWDTSTDTLLQKDYFSKIPQTGEKMNYEKFTNTYFLNHYRAFRDAIRSVWPQSIMLCQPPVMEVPPDLKGTIDDDPNMVHAVHYYDGLTLMTKHWNRFYNVDVIGVLRGKYWAPAFGVKVGETAIRNCLRDQLKFLREESINYMGNHPMVFTEIGIPYDMDNKYAYQTGDYSSQTSAMDANHFALEGSTSNGYTIWVYETENSHKWGDNWNGEDLSNLFRDDLELPTGAIIPSHNPNSPSYSETHGNVGGAEIGPRNLKRALTTPSISSTHSQDPPPKGYRAAEAYLRPSPVYVGGTLTSHAFDLRSCTFTMSLTAKAPTDAQAPTEIHLPEFHFPVGNLDVEISGGKWELDNYEVQSVKLQRLRWWHAEGEQELKVQGVIRKPGGIANPAGEDITYMDQCQRGECAIM